MSNGMRGGSPDLLSAPSVLTGERSSTPHQHAYQVGAPAFDLDREVLAALDAAPRTGPTCSGCGAPQCSPWGYLFRDGVWSCLVCPSKWAPGHDGTCCGSCGKALAPTGTIDDPRISVQASGGRELRCAKCHADSLKPDRDDAYEASRESYVEEQRALGRRYL